MSWQKLDSETLTGTSDNIDAVFPTSKKFNMFMTHAFGASDINMRSRVGNGSIDTGTNYAFRRTENGAADDVNTSSNLFGTGGIESTNMFEVGYFINISTEEKLFISFVCSAMTAGAGTAPSRSEVNAKWAQTSSQIDNFRKLNDTASDYAIDSNLTLLGTD